MAGQFGVPTNPETILDKVRKRLVAHADLADTACFYAMGDDEDLIKTVPVDRCFAFALRAIKPLQPAVIGGGNQGLLIEAELRIASLCRLNMDIRGRSDEFLLNDLGMLKHWVRCIKALQLWTPQDDNLDYLLYEPMRWLDEDPYERRPIHGWGRFVGRWQIKWIQKMS